MIELLKKEDFETIWGKALAMRTAIYQEEVLNSLGNLQIQPSIRGVRDFFNKLSEVSFLWQIFEDGLSHKAMLEKEIDKFSIDLGNFEIQLCNALKWAVARANAFSFSISSTEELSFPTDHRFIEGFVAGHESLRNLELCRVFSSLSTGYPRDSSMGGNARINLLTSLSNLARNFFTFPNLYWGSPISVTEETMVEIDETMREYHQQNKNEIIVNFPLEFYVAKSWLMTLAGVKGENPQKFEEAADYLRKARSYFISRDEEGHLSNYALDSNAIALPALIKRIITSPRFYPQGPRWATFEDNGKLYKVMWGIPLFNLIDMAQYDEDKRYDDDPFKAFEKPIDNPIVWLRENLKGKNIQEIAKEFEGSSLVEELDRYIKLCDAMAKNGYYKTFVADVASYVNLVPYRVEEFINRLLQEKCTKALVSIFLYLAMKIALSREVDIGDALATAISSLPYLIEKDSP